MIELQVGKNLVTFSPVVTYTSVAQEQQNKNSMCDFTQTAELTDDGWQRVVGYTFQLGANPIGHCAVAQVPWLNVPLNQRHGSLLRRVHSTCWGISDSSVDTATSTLCTPIHKTTLKAAENVACMRELSHTYQQHIITAWRWCILCAKFSKECHWRWQFITSRASGAPFVWY